MSLKIKVIYNPRAGKKRLVASNNKGLTSLEDLKRTFEQYQLEADFFPTEYPKHATKLAQEAIKQKYDLVVAAGGDGTVGETANGLIGSKVILGVIPFGSYMNIARMLSIPFELEKAVMLLKIGRVRKIDVGAITVLSGEKLEKPYIFLESIGFGLEAQLHRLYDEFEKGNWAVPFTAIKTVIDYLKYKAEIIVDEHTIKTRVTMINIANGPYSGPAIPIAPEAKLNDHHLTVTILRMRKLDLFYYFLRMWFGFKRKRKPTIYQTQKVQINTSKPRLVHADARLFGETPVEAEVIPAALSVISGYESKEEPLSAFKKHTYLAP